MEFSIRLVWANRNSRGYLMFGELLLGAASGVGGRASPIQGATRSSDLSSRTRSDGDAAFSQKASDAAGGLAQSRADVVAAKGRAADARHGKRRRTDASEDEHPRPRIKFKVPERDGRTGPIFEEEGREVVEPSEPLLDGTISVAARRATSAESDDELGHFVDLYA